MSREEPFDPRLLADERLTRLPQPRKLHPERLLEREDKALHKAHLDMARVGVNVSKEAQALFDILCKTQVHH